MGEIQSVISMTNIHKSFSGIEVLHGVDFDVRSGEVHALMGENGAGKSTLMKILMGEMKMDAGSIQANGENVQIEKPTDAHRYGLRMIHQELCLIPDMTIAENIFAGRELSRHGLVKKQEQNARTAEILKGLDLKLNPKTRVRDLRTAQMQMVEITKAVSFGANVIVMDEPTSSISTKDTQHLFQIIRKLKEQGIAFIYITHRMEEVFQIADRMTILRDGSRVACEPMRFFDHDKIIQMMVGRELKDYFPERNCKIGSDPVLSVRNLSRTHEFRDISFDLYPGEILGLAGLVGAGRTELASVIFGVHKPDSGSIRVRGRTQRFSSPKKAVAQGVALVPEDRKMMGLNLIGSVRDNILTLVEKKNSAHGFIRRSRRNEQAASMVQKLSIKIHSLSQLTGKLSGGNQQKVVLAKWLLREPEIMILDEPTRGIDVGSRADIYKLINEMANQGKAILLISSDMPEIIGMCDRIAVLAEGRMTGILERKEVTQERIMELASQITV